MKSNFKLNSAWRHLSPDQKLQKLIAYLIFHDSLVDFYRYCLLTKQDRNKVRSIRNYLVACEFDYNWVCNYLLDCKIETADDLYEIAKTPWLDV